MKRHLVLGLGLVALLAAACGGPSKPPENGTDPTPTTTKTSDPTGKPPGPNEGAVAKSSSDDVTRGVAAFKAGDLNTAKASFEAAITKNPKQADAHHYLGVVLEQDGKKAEAEKEYKTAFELAPDLQEAAANLVAIYIETKRYDEAVEVAKLSLTKNSKNADMHMNYATALAGKGDQPASAKEYEEAIKLAPNDARFYLGYAHTLADWKKKDQALAKLKQAVGVAGDDPVMLGSIAYEYKIQRAVPECIATFDKAIGFKDNADFRTNRAQCKVANKDRAGAMADLDAAIALDGNFPVARMWRAKLLHEDARYPEAVAEYEAFLKLVPKGPAAKRVEEQIKLAKDKKKPAPAAPAPAAAPK